MGKRRALLIGINDYPGKENKLTGCIADIDAVKSVLSKNGDGSDNFEIERMADVLSSKDAMGQIEALFSAELDIALLYFSGHGFVNSTGAEIVFPDDAANNSYYNGLQMRTIMDIVNRSKAKNKIVILDCCHAGDFGKYRIDIDSSDLGIGVTILSACKGDETAAAGYVEGGLSRFTTALCIALSGPAADITGNITIGNVYSYIDQFFSSTEQRPVFKTNVTEFVPLRRVKPRMSIESIREILTLFPSFDKELQLDPSFEFTNSEETRIEIVEPFANPENVEIMKKLQEFVNIGFVEPVDEEHMFFAAMHNKKCRLTTLGQYYWLLVKKGRL